MKNSRLDKWMLGIAAAGVCLTAGISLAEDEEKKAMVPDEAVAVLQPTSGYNTAGMVTFRETVDGKIEMVANISGLKPNSEHAIHVHQYGDLTAADGTNAGSHFNPEGHEHGLPSEEDARHAGDFGNLKADDQGNAKYSLIVDNISIEGDHSILGRAVIIHEKADTGGQPTGDAGARIAQGVIGIRHPDSKLANMAENAGDRIRNAVADGAEALRKALQNAEESFEEATSETQGAE